MTVNADFVVIGSGLSGLNSVLAIAKELPKTSIILIEPHSVTTGASSAPMGLLNPSTSRSPNIIEDAESLLDQAIANYGELRNEENELILAKKGIFKAVPLGEDAPKWKQKYHKTAWPDGWSEWVEAKDVEHKLEMHKEAAPNGGILIHESWVVPMAKLRSALIKKCKALTSHFIEKPIEKIDVTKKEIYLKNISIKYDNILLANGYDIFIDTYFSSWLTAHPIKGQMLTITTSALPSFKIAITNSGYLGQLSESKYAVGSTYEHHFSHLKPDDDGRDRLIKKSQHLLGYELPEKNIDSFNQWTAVRVASKDRKPLIGKHPEIEGLYLINGMASKGLIYAPTAAKHLVAYILGDKKALKNWDLQRYLAK